MAEESKPVAEEKSEPKFMEDGKQLNRLLCIIVLVQAIVAMLMVGIFQNTRQMLKGLEIMAKMQVMTMPADMKKPEAGPKAAPAKK